MEQKYYTAKHMAEYLDCSEQTVYKMGYRGDLETRKIGGLRRFRLKGQNNGTEEITGTEDIGLPR